MPSRTSGELNQHWDRSTGYKPGWLGDVDRRTRDVRAVIQSREALVRDLGGDLSSQKAMIVDRVAFLSLRLTMLERDVLNGMDIDWSHYAYIANVFTGLLKTLGLERQVKPVMTLQAYIENGE